MINRQQGAPPIRAVPAEDRFLLTAGVPDHLQLFPVAGKPTKGPSPPPGKTAPERSPCPPGTEGAAALHAEVIAAGTGVPVGPQPAQGDGLVTVGTGLLRLAGVLLDQRRRAASLFQLIFWFVNKIQKGQRCHLPSIKVKSYCPVINRGSLTSSSCSAMLVSMPSTTSSHRAAFIFRMASSRVPA